MNHFLTRPNARSVESPNRSIAQQNTPALLVEVSCTFAIRLHFTLSLHFTRGPPSAVRSPQSAFYTDRFKNDRIPAVSKAHLLEFYGVRHVRDWNMAQFVSQCQ